MAASSRGSTEALRRYWSKGGQGGATIKWGTKGSFDRCAGEGKASTCATTRRATHPTPHTPRHARRRSDQTRDSSVRARLHVRIRDRPIPRDGEPTGRILPRHTVDGREQGETDQAHASQDPPLILTQRNQQMSDLCDTWGYIPHPGKSRIGRYTGRPRLRVWGMRL